MQANSLPSEPPGKPIHGVWLWFFRQEYWSELPCPSPGDLPDLRIEPTSAVSPTLQEGCLSAELPARYMLSLFCVGVIYAGREGNGNPLWYSCLESSMDGGAWWAAVQGFAKSRTQLSDFTFTFHFHELEKEMATHSSVLAWRIPGMGEPGRLLSMGSHRVGHEWSDLAAAASMQEIEGNKAPLGPCNRKAYTPFWVYTQVIIHNFNVRFRE